MKILHFLLTVMLLSFVNGANNRVVELSDRFLELRGDSTWLIMFYAPWCGHCRKLEPVWGHVAQAMYGTQIRVGRVDATRFTALASEFSVKGYPTIIFVKGAERYTFTGDRTTADIVGFGRRMAGPPLPAVTELPRLSFMPTAEFGKEKEEGGMFIYGGEKQGELFEVYSWLSEQYRMFHYFYTMEGPDLKRHLGLEDSEDLELPCVMVYKDGDNQKFNDKSMQPLGATLNESMSRWVNHERFPFFMKFTGGNLNQVFGSDKIVAMVVVEETKTGILATDETAFRDMLQTVEREHRDKYHSRIQFGWTGAPYLANNLAITRLPLPSLLVINTTTLTYHLPTHEAHVLNHSLVIEFLDEVLAGTAEAHGGDSYLMRVNRSLFTARTSLEDMWQGNPVLTALLFGLPLGFLSLILYSICCTDIMDASEEDEEGEGLEEYENRVNKESSHQKTD